MAWSICIRRVVDDCILVSCIVAYDGKIREELMSEMRQISAESVSDAVESKWR